MEVFNALWFTFLVVKIKMNFYIRWVIFVVKRNFKLYSKMNAKKLKFYSRQSYVVWRYVVLTKKADIFKSCDQKYSLQFTLF